MAHKQRGAAAYAIIFLMLLALGSSHLLIKDQANYFKQAKKEREAKSAAAAREAKQALINYMLLRAENDLEIAQGATGSVRPRLLMLPCPDNVGDKNLDGAQEGACGGAGSGASDIVNGILRGGSRFGRLPWRSRNVNNVNNSINDGINADMRDAAGNRLWYVASRNIVPTTPQYESARLPLNFHRLMTHQDEWLKVINERGEEVKEKIAAVILAPDKALQPRYPESALEMLVLDHSRDVAAPDGLLAPVRYFESYRATLGVSVRTVENYNLDGVFIRAPRSEEQGFNDALAYISIDKLINDGGFIKNYARLVGAGDVHNLPTQNRPLANAAAALSAHYALLGFYPPPARRDVPVHVSQRERHCMRTHSGADAYVITLTAGVRLSSARPVTVRASAAPPAAVTVTLAQPAAFLLRQHAEASAVATVMMEDIAQTVTALTLARYARVTLAAGAPLRVTADALQTLALTVFRLVAGVEAMLAATAVITLAPRTPLRPFGDLLGWFADHALDGQRAGDDGDKFILPAATRGMFWADARLTIPPIVATLKIGDVLTLAAGSTLQIEEDFDELENIDAEVFYADGRAVTLYNVLPTPATYERRQFAVWLLTDAAHGAQSVAAPALLFPWRAEAGSSGADSRDNLHYYPPCLDTRNFFTRRFQTTAEDQNIVYAVARECHYGGAPAACGRSGGLTVSIAAGAAVALPQAVTLTHSYQARVGNVLNLDLQNGVVQNAADVVLRQKITFPVLNSGGVTLAAFRLPAGYRFISGEPVILPAQTPMTGEAGAVFENVPALLIYSPAPLPRAACALGADAPPPAGTLALTPPITLVNQQAETSDITNLCYWLDDEENADGDDFYVIYPPETRRGVSPRNDFFILLDGRLRIG